MSFLPGTWDMSVGCVLSDVCLGLDLFPPKLWLNKTLLFHLSGVPVFCDGIRSN